MKRVTSLFLSFIMLFSVITSVNLSVNAASNPYSGGNSNCTAYAWQRTYDKLGIALPAWTGNAKAWYSSAKNDGYPTSSQPSANWIAVWDGTTLYGNENRGHVAFVESVNGNQITISEGGYGNPPGKHTETYTPSSTRNGQKLLGYFNPNKNGIVKYTVSFYGNGGTVSQSTLTVNAGSAMGKNIPTATNSQNGMVFDGWYTAQTGGTKYSTNTIINCNTKLYAHWVKSSSPLTPNHIYRIINKNSGLALQANGSGDGAHIAQQSISSSIKQYWMVGADGGTTFTSMYGRKSMDVKGGVSNMNNGEILQVYGNSSAGKSNRSFSIVPRGSSYYSIHPNSSNRAFDISGSSVSSGAELTQYYYHGGANQLFYFQEITDRNVTFYDNLNDSYINSLDTNITNYTSRDTSYLKTSVDKSQGVLTINSLKAGSAGKDLLFSTTINDSYNYEFSRAQTNTVTLIFRAKSSVNGTKMYFRWGYDPSTAIASATIDTTWKTFCVRLPRTKDSGSNIHPWIDRACTVNMKDIMLVDGDVTGVSISYEVEPGLDDSSTKQVKTYNINNNASTCTLPKPQKTKSGCHFVGWYTQRIGGEKIIDGQYKDNGNNRRINDLKGKYYAHWEPHTYYVYNSITDENGVTKTTYKCKSCNYSYSVSTKNPHTHSYKQYVTPATDAKDGKIESKCSICGDISKSTIIYKVSNIKLSRTSITNTGTVQRPSVTVTDSKGKQLVYKQDFTVNYSNWNSKDVGRYTVTVTMQGNYSGTYTYAYYINPKPTTLSSVTARSKGFTVKWNKQTSQTTGYQIQYATKKDFSNAATVYGGPSTANSKTITGRAGNTRYYVRIRTYKNIGGKYFYSSWSSAKSVVTYK